MINQNLNSWSIPLTRDKSEINMDQFSTGIYVVKIFDDNTASIVRKIVVK